MNKTLRILISLVGIIALIIVIGIVLLVTVVNPNDFKPQISQAVQKYTGQSLSIKGKIHWTFFPLLGLKVNNVDLANPPGFDQSSFASIGEADIGVRLLPLFTGHIELGRVKLKDTIINLIKNEAGRKNWQTLINTKTKSSSTQANALEQPSKTKTFIVTSINIDNANINYIDEQTGKNLSVIGLTLISKDIEPGKPFNGILRFKLQRNKPFLVVNCNLSGMFKIDLKQNRYQAKMFKTTFVVNDPAFSKKQMTFNLLADKADADLNEDVLTLKNMSFHTEGFNISGDISGQNITTTPLYNGIMTITPFNVRETLEHLGHPLVTVNRNGYNKFTANFNFIASPRFVKIQNLNATLDNATLQGNVNYAILGDRSLTFNLAINQLNLDNYKLKSSKTQSSSSRPSKPTTKKRPKTPIKINGNITIKKLVANQIVLNKVNAQISGTNQLLNIDPLTANIYGGSMRSSITIDQQGIYPRYQVQTTLSNVKIQSISKKSPIIGPANISANVTTFGNTTTSQLSNLNGNLSFKANNGQLKTINVEQTLQKILSFIETGKKSNPNATTQGGSSFSVLSATATITNGLIRNDDLTFISSKATVHGSGTANLVTEQLNYYVKLVASANIKGLAGNSLINLQNIPIPIRITGTFSKPIVLPDFATIAGLVLQNKIQKGISSGINLGKVIPENAGKTIQKGLESILGK